MRNVNIFLLAIISISIFQGCGTKRQYFKPKGISYNVSYDGNLPASIVDVTKGGATLGNGEVITKKGIKDIKVPVNFSFLGDDHGKYLIASGDGRLEILDNNSKVLYKRKFETQVVAASIKKSVIALILSTNRLMIINIKSNKEILNSKQDDIYAVDSRIASPYFLDSLIIFPTLDGKLLIADRKSGKIIKNVVVGDEKFFGNIIYLGVLGNRLVAATKKRVVSINPKSMEILDVDVKDVVVLKNRVFVFTKDGTVILCDADLKVLKKKKFPFAVFAGAIYGDFIYMIERGGYLIATDVDLISTNIYKMPDNIDSYLFFTKNALYYKDKYLKLIKK